MMSSAARVDHNKIQDFQVLKLHKKIAFYPNRNFFFAKGHCMEYRIRSENKNFDDMGILSMTL